MISKIKSNWVKNKKSIIKFLIIFLISYFVMEIVEYSLNYFFNFNLHNLKWGWLILIVIYGFKYHIFCCLFPALFASYKCRHKSCSHNHCDGIS